MQNQFIMYNSICLFYGFFMIGSVPAFDIIVFSILGLSALMGFARGVTREIFGILSWSGAGVATYLGYPHAKGLAAIYIKNPQIAEYATYATMFIALLVIFSIFSHLLSTLIKNSVFGGVDRSLGFGFGLIRAVFLLALLDLAMGVFFTRNAPPEFMKNTRTLSHVHYLGDHLVSVIPEKWQKFIQTNQKNDADLKEQIIQTVEEIKKNQEKNADDLANIMPQVEDTNEQDAQETAVSTPEMDKLIEDGSKIEAPATAQYLDDED
ncbi:MAG TPA: hypothetical protein DIC42_06200 [Holosporales bacterium]|nr:hypothetical protein [Holosporales bacterium]